MFRGQRVILDSNLSTFYNLPTKRFNKAFKRNTVKFPDDFSFPRVDNEHVALRSQFAISIAGNGQHRKYLAVVFTAHCAPMDATLEEQTQGVVFARDTFSRKTRTQLKQLFDALRELANTTPPTEPPKRPIGFVTHEDKK